MYSLFRFVFLFVFPFVDSQGSVIVVYHFTSHPFLIKYSFQQVVIDFERIFGLELKSIISDPTQIDDVRKRVQNLVYPIRTIDFSIFAFDNKENWDVIMGDFWAEVRYLEEEAKNYINASFGNLRYVTTTNGKGTEKDCLG